MTKKIVALWVIAGLGLIAGPAWAQPPSFANYQLDTPGNPPVQLFLPTPADTSPAIAPLGSAVDPVSGKVVEGYAFIHYKDAYAHQASSKGSGTKCYSYLARGAKWKTIESWVMNPTNTRALDLATLFNLQSAALAKWEDASDGVVGNSVGVEIFGSGLQIDAALAADTVSPDGQNEAYFADISTSGAIAVTIVWGFFSGPPQTRELVEWDQVYDDVDFDWSAGATGVAGKMDFDNIATHEDGHSAGMGHPDDSCVDETMYRFAAFAETKKRDLNTGDIAGVNVLY